MSEPREYDVLFLHVHKQHIYENIAGALAAGLETGFVTPLYNRGLTRLLLGGMPNRIGKMVREHQDPRLDRAHIRTSFLWSLRRIFANYVHSREGKFFRAFDRWCAAGLRSGKFRAKIVYVFQDYLPRTCEAALEVGAKLVTEQIINNAQPAQERVLASTRQVSFPVTCPEYPLDQATNERLLGISTRVIVPCGYVQGDIQSHVAPGKMWRVPYGANLIPGRKAPNGASSNGASPKSPSPIVIAVRATSVRKGGHLLLEALLRHPPEDLFPGHGGEVEFLMIGKMDPQFLPAVERIHVLRPRVKIRHGHLPHAEVMERLACADFFVGPSLSESTSLAVLEAAAAGLPLVITPYCGLDEFVDGEQGILIAEASPAGIAAALHKMFSRRAEWPEYGRKARAMIEAHPWKEFGRLVGENLRTLLPP